MSFSYTLSADGGTTSVRAQGTVYSIKAYGTWGGGTLTPQVKDGATWVTLGDTTLTANGVINVEVDYGADIRANLAGASSPSLTVKFSKIRR